VRFNVDAWLKGRHFAFGIDFQRLWRPMPSAILPRLDLGGLDGQEVEAARQALSVLRRPS